LLIYKIAFANDWAEGLAIKAVSGIAKDAMPPAQALTAPAQVLANLQALAVTAVSTTALQVDAGADPPAGGGFEVRRRDWDFGPAVDQDFVLRSSVRSFYLPRATQTEQFYVRMYDASTPPLYSRFSSVVIANLPTS
jgi:hypothetical protein